MILFEKLSQVFAQGVKAIFGEEIDPNKVLINTTKKEFEGSYTIVLFPYLKQLKTNPVVMGEKLGDYLVDKLNIVKDTNTVKGFLNIELSNDYWTQSLRDIVDNDSFGKFPANGQKVMVEFSSPNTNKPLHLGHIRNILLGWSCSKILEANGYEVIKTQVINDRGIAICKSMLAWSLFGEGETPSSTETKGDHFIGKFYVLFESKFKEEYKDWLATETGKKVFDTEKKEEEEVNAFAKRYKNLYFNNYSNLGKQARNLLLAWEKGDEKTVSLWKKMNAWVYEGFDTTYKKLGVEFDVEYHESNTYLLGKSMIEKGLKDGVFYQMEDSSVWIDLEDVGMDKKIILRSDGTSVYITQDIGTAHKRYEDYKIDKLIYTVADEQDYHFNVLFEIMKRLEEPYASGMYHLSYGMVDLPTGKMKSREGTVVDADDLIAEVISEANFAAEERGEMSGMTKEEQNELIRKIGLAALKFFIIKVQPKKRMIFDPKESVDMQGQTGPYIQNAYVRILSILRRHEDKLGELPQITELHPLEIDLIKQLNEYPDVVREAGKQYEPSHIANYCYALAKTFHRFYHDVRILKAESEEAKLFRLVLSAKIADVLKDGMNLLGIEMPTKM